MNFIRSLKDDKFLLTVIVCSKMPIKQQSNKGLNVEVNCAVQYDMIGCVQNHVSLKNEPFLAIKGLKYARTCSTLSFLVVFLALMLQAKFEKSC